MTDNLTEAQTAALICARLFAPRTDEEVWRALADASEANAEAMEARDFERAEWTLSLMEALTKEVKRRIVKGSTCPASC